MANHWEEDSYRNKFKQNLFPQETAKETLPFFNNLFWVDLKIKIRNEIYFYNIKYKVSPQHKGIPAVGGGLNQGQLVTKP